MCWRDLGWIRWAANGGLRKEVYGVCCGYLSRSPAPARAGLINAHGMSQWDRREKAAAEGRAGLPTEWRLRISCFCLRPSAKQLRQAQHRRRIHTMLMARRGMPAIAQLRKPITHPSQSDPRIFLASRTPTTLPGIPRSLMLHYPAAVAANAVSAREAKFNVGP